MATKPTINEIFAECFKNVPIGKEFTRKEIVKIIQKDYPVPVDSILPSDLCYNSSNRGIEGNGSTRLFMKIRRGYYKYVGPDFDSSKANPYEFGTLPGEESRYRPRKYIEPLDDNHTVEEQEQQAFSMDMDSLRRAAEMRSSKKPAEREVVSKQIVRDTYVSVYAKTRANGICQLCGKEAPFKDKNGKPYLETHHIIWLSDGGEDSVKNTVGLCPNCHRKMHVVADLDDIEFLLNKAKEND